MKEGLSIAEVLQSNLESLGAIPHILVLAIGSVLLLMTGLFTSSKKVLVGIFLAILALTFYVVPEETTQSFSGQLFSTLLASKVQLLSLIVTLGLLLFKSFWEKPFEYQFLILALLIGCLLMTISRHLLIIYLAVELTSVVSYMLTSFNFNKAGIEGAFKYLLIGLTSSAFMLYGISLLYGASGGFFVSTLSSPLEIGGALLLLVGILFKVSVFPLHTWVPNTYQSAPTDLVFYLSVVPKVCAFVLLGYLVHAFDNELIKLVLWVFSIATVIAGTLGAVSQQNVKRLIGYGAVAHSGFILPFLIMPGSREGSQFLLYVLIYAVMNLAIFFFISVFEEKKDLTLDSLSGMGKSNPLFGAANLVVLLALIGLPPTAGFSIKLILFSEVWSEYATGQNMALMIFFLVGIISTAISLFYYLRIPYHYYLVETRTEHQNIAPKFLVVSTFLAAALLWFFIQPEILDNFVTTIPKP